VFGGFTSAIEVGAYTVDELIEELNKEDSQDDCCLPPTDYYAIELRKE
jgi:hypothetical protein